MKTQFLRLGSIPQSQTLPKLNRANIGSRLAKRLYREFNRAIGLVAHGVGIGAFVYLRRIFENLIEEAHRTQLNQPDWNEDEYRKCRMEERIHLLKTVLPSFLVEHRQLYGVLSKAIHELAEDECKRIFPVVKTSIELILDEKIEAMERKQKIASAKSAVSSVIQQMKSEQA